MLEKNGWCYNYYYAAINIPADVITYNIYCTELNDEWCFILIEGALGIRLVVFTVPLLFVVYGYGLRWKRQQLHRKVEYYCQTKWPP